MKPKVRESDWQFWVAVPVVGIALYAGLTLFHRFTEPGRGLSVDGLAMVGTTLFAAATGFLAVLFQIRSSSKQLREQMRTQRDAEREEQERQKKAVATGILFEIDNFYVYHVGGAYDYIREVLQRRELPEVARIPSSLFSMYQGNTGRLGDLPNEVVRVVVDFYSKAAQFLAVREDYRAEHERHLDLRFEHPDNWKTVTLCGHVRDFFPGLARAAYIACEKLCDVAGLEFKPPSIAVASADIAALNRETERIEHEEDHRI
jgi:hypothetical protein